MKQVFVFTILFCFFNARLWAQIPQSFQYQAIARDKDQKPLAGATLEVEVKILRNGTEVFSETHGDVKTAPTGLFVLAVGSKEPADFSTINWALSGYSLKVSTTGALVLDLPPSPILSVPYALMAEEVRTEKQQLTLSNGNVLSITGGNSVTLPTGGQNLQAGQGIGISNNTITNTGDTDPTDDLIKTSTAGGDVSGTFSTLSVDRIKGRPLASATPQNGQVLKWDAAAGTWKPDNDLNTVGSGNTATAAPILGDGSAGNQVRLAPGNASGQVLKWNGTTWGPAADETGTGASNTYAAGPGISVTGSSPNFTINNTGDTNAADDLTTATNFGGDVSGTFNNLQINANAIGATELANGAVTGAKIAQQNATDGQVLKWNTASGTWLPQNDIGGGTGDGWGSQTAVTGTTLTGNGSATSPLNLAPQGASNGQVLKWNATNSTWIPAQDLSASTLEDLLDVTTTGVINGQVLQWNGTQWAPTSPKTYSAGAGITIDAQNKIINTAPDVPLSLLGGGATTVTGTYPNLTVTTPAAAAYTAGPGITVTGSSPNFTINNTGDTNAADDLTNATNFGGDVSGTYNNLQIGTDVIGSNEIANGSVGSAEIADGSIGAIKIADGSINNSKIVDGTLTGSKIAQQGAADGQVLKWDDVLKTWKPSSDNDGGSLGWNLTGNAGTDPATNFIGTTDAQPISFRVNDTLRMKLWGDGRLELFNRVATNTFVGQGAGQSNTTGRFNTANGADALFSNTIGLSNTAHGYRALLSNTTGNQNTANGALALKSNTDGYNNTANGAFALESNIDGYNNTATGAFALESNIDGYNNTANGAFALKSNTTGESNTATGINALLSNTTGRSNTANGVQALSYNITGNRNTANGAFALNINTTGDNNTANGYDALYSNTTGDNNTANGYDALYSNTTGNRNTANGYLALRSNKTGNSNVAFGAHALYSNTASSNLVAVGDSALYSNTGGVGNTALGSKSLSTNTTGVNNTATGAGTLRFNNGNSNTAFGFQALEDNQDGNNNSAFGYQALNKNTAGTQNTAIGSAALFGNTSGSENIAIGDAAGTSNKTGSRNTFVGKNTNANLDNLVNATAIGYSANATVSNSVRIGNTGISSIGGQVGWSNLSDSRVKTAIAENIPGLAFIQKLRPVSYRYDIRRQNALLGITDTAQWEGKYDIEKMTFSGFIAQEVEQAARSIGYDFSGVDAPKNDKSLYGLRYAEFTVPLVKAVQEQQAMIEEQKRLIQALEARLSALEKTLPKDNNSQKGE